MKAITFYVEILPLIERESDEIFKIDSHLIKENSLGEHKSLKEIIKNLKVNTQDNTNVEYSSSNGLG